MRQGDLGSTQKLPENQCIHNDNDDNNAKSHFQVDDTSCDIILFLKNEIDQIKIKAEQMKEEQTTIIEQMKEEQTTIVEQMKEQATLIEQMQDMEQAISSRNYEETIEELEEIRSLVSSTTTNTNHTPNINTRRGDLRQRMLLSMFGRTSATILMSKQNTSLNCDTFSLMMISPVRSRSWILGFVSSPFEQINTVPWPIFFCHYWIP